MPPFVANFSYVIIIMFAAIISLALRYSGEDLNMGFLIGISPPSICAPGYDCDAISYQICNGEACVGYWAVYRISFAVAGFFFIMALLTSCASRFSTIAHRGYWFMKVLFIAGVLGGFLFTPNDVLAYYAWAARFVAPLFLLYQCVLYIDFGYTVNAKLLQQDEDEAPFLCCGNDGMKYRWFMLLSSCTLFLGSIAGTVLMYHFFPSSCGFNALAVTTTLLFGLFNTAIGLSPLSEHGSILTSSIIFAYTTWLCFSALSSFPSASCNPSYANASEHLGWLIISCVVASISIGYMAFKMGRRQSQPPTSMGVAMSGTPDEESSRNPADEIHVDVANDPTPPSERFVFYHLIMMIVCIYMSMLLTDWGVPNSRTTQRYNVGIVSAWLQLATSWTCSILYLWTLIAARCCPDRDFG